MRLPSQLAAALVAHVEIDAAQSGEQDENAGDGDADATGFPGWHRTAAHDREAVFEPRGAHAGEMHGADGHGQDAGTGQPPAQGMCRCEPTSSAAAPSQMPSISEEATRVGSQSISPPITQRGHAQIVHRGDADAGDGATQGGVRAALAEATAHQKPPPAKTMAMASDSRVRTIS